MSTRNGLLAGRARGVVWTALSAPALMAASPPPNAFLATPLFAETTLGTPSAPSAPLPAGAFTPAPLPDIDRAAPMRRVLGPPQAEFSPGLFRPHATYRGEGYLYGSTVQGQQDRNLRPAPGVNVKMPLD